MTDGEGASIVFNVISIIIFAFVVGGGNHNIDITAFLLLLEFKLPLYIPIQPTVHIKKNLHKVMATDQLGSFLTSGHR